MTVQEFITKLKEANPDSNVWIGDFPIDGLQVYDSMVIILSAELDSALSNLPEDYYLWMLGLKF